MGLIAGIALKKVGMFLAVVVGVAFAALQVTGLTRQQPQGKRCACFLGSGIDLVCVAQLCSLAYWLSPTHCVQAPARGWGRG